MNKLKKIGLTALAGTLVAGTVNAAEMTVTGSASINLTGLDSSENTGTVSYTHLTLPTKRIV